MRFGMLGALQVARDGVALDVGRPQERMLLARLLVDAGRTVPVDRLVHDLWGERPPAGAVGTLQAYVSRLRRVLEPARTPGAAPQVLVTRPPGYALLVAPEAIDAARFEARASSGRELTAEGRLREAVAAFDEALGMWRGEVLADCRDAAFVAPIAARLTALRDDAAEQRATALLALGETAAAIGDLEVLVAGDVLRERAWELLLCALHATGRTVEALDRYRVLRERLAEELGLDPGPGLQAVEQALLRGETAAVVDIATAGASTAAVGHSPRGAARAPGQVDGATPPPASPDTPAGDLASSAVPGDALVGRRSELAVLELALGAAREGRTAWVALVGEAGIGKTRLVRHLAELARERGARVVVGPCHAADGTPAFWPWVQVLRGLEDLVPGAAAILEADSAATGDSAARLFSLFDRVAGVLGAAARRVPLAIVLEDLHWADEESLQLVDFLAVQLRDLPIAVALTCRRDEGLPSLRATIADLARQPGATRLDLAGLDTAAVGQLLAALTGREVGCSTAQELHERTGGNPFFVTELARLGDGALSSDALPDTVREVLARRLATLPTGAVRMLALAAVHGAEFSLDALVATSDADELDVLDQLDEAIAARLVVATDDPLRFRFTHALVREAALDGVPDLRRRRLHLRIAGALRELTPDHPTAWRAEVAHHLLAAAPLGEAREALDAARAAAELADARLAFHEAARWYEGALRVLDWDRALGADQRLRHDLLVAHGRALGDAGDRPAALRCLAEAIDVADALGDARAMAAAAIAFDHTGGFWYWAEYGNDQTELLERLDRVVAALGSSDPDLRVRVLSVAAVGHYYGDQLRGRALADEALDLARAAGDPELRCVALVAAIRTNWSHHDLDGQHARTAELLDLAVVHRLEHKELLGWTYSMAWALVEGRLDEAETAYHRALAISQRLGLVLFSAQLAWTAPIFPLARGDVDGAARRLSEARELHARTRLYSLEVITAWNMWVRAVLTGSFAALDPLRTDVAAVFPEGEALLRLREGDAVAARELLETTIEQQPLRPLFDAVGLAVVRARVVADLGAADLAPPLIAALEPYAGYLGALGTCCTTWPVAIDLARLLALVGRRDEAAALLEGALERCARAGWPLWARLARAALDEVRAAAASPTPV